MARMRGRQRRSDLLGSKSNRFAQSEFPSEVEGLYRAKSRLAAARSKQFSASLERVPRLRSGSRILQLGSLPTLAQSADRLNRLCERSAAIQQHRGWIASLRSQRRSEPHNPHSAHVGIWGHPMECPPALAQNETPIEATIPALDALFPVSVMKSPSVSTYCTPRVIAL